MALRLVPLPVSTFGEIAALGLEVHVWCQRCKRARPLPLNSPALYARIFVGARFRCARPLWDGSICNAGGIPTIRRCVPPWCALQIDLKREPWRVPPGRESSTAGV